MTETNEKIGGKIKKYRTSIKMTQAEFAERLGVTGAAVSAYENGIRQPSFGILVKNLAQRQTRFWEEPPVKKRQLMSLN